ncbi:hypothetical protein ACFQY0_13490 [Haloferula chungangensis]|uniref:Uncharacterized protein n=1 Tax=Haloferula chungangensis TaxID=1048331 RepID=A0ABW2L766_9BACT
MKTLGKWTWTVLSCCLLVGAGLVFAELAGRGESQVDLRSPEVIHRILGYDFPQHWKIEAVDQTDGRYYWAIDGGVTPDWISSIGGTPEDGSDTRWDVAIADGDGIHRSSVFIRCPKRCCIAVEAARPKKSKAEQGVAPQSATRSESDSEGGDKPQPESEPRPR